MPERVPRDDEGAGDGRAGAAPPRRKKGALREYGEAIGFALLIALVLRSFVVEAFKIPSGSMMPTLEVGDRIFVNKMAYRAEVPWSLLGVRLPYGGTTLRRWDSPGRGDIVVFRHPGEPDVDYIKRVVAVEGDRLEVRGGVLSVNGKPVPRRKIGLFPHKDQTCREVVGELYEEVQDGRPRSVLQGAGPDRLGWYGPITVRAGHVFAMGDSRDNSRDSRVWGQLPVDLIKGRAMVTWLSLDACGGAKRPVRFSRLFRKVR